LAGCNLDLGLVFERMEFLKDGTALFESRNIRGIRPYAATVTWRIAAADRLIITSAGSDVYIKKIGEAVILFPVDKEWEVFLHGLNSFSEDFMSEERSQGNDQKREDF
jgi:virulence-associated protein VagC